MTISEKVAYLKGLAEGLNLDVEKSKEGKLISVMIGILEEDEDDYFEVECPNCEEPIVIDDKALAEGEVECPNCQTKFSLDLSDDTVEGDEE